MSLNYHKWDIFVFNNVYMQYTRVSAMSTTGLYPHVRFIDFSWGVQNLEYFQGSWKQYPLTESHVASNN